MPRTLSTRLLTAALLALAALWLVPLAAAGNGNGQTTAPGQVKQTTTTTSSTASDHQTQGTAGTSGSPSQTQPTSSADQNTGGANGQCPGGAYCSTRDGSASLNGKGSGQATGKPCAGCVGKADNKNPKGQAPNGSDHNSGYECDKNNGIGKTNPAHTGCKQTPPPCSANCTPPCSSNCAPPCQSNCQPSSCSVNCAPSSTPPGQPITVTCPQGGGTIMVTGPSGSYTVTCKSGQKKTITPRQPGIVKVITKTHTVVQRVGVTAPSGKQLTG